MIKALALLLLFSLAMSGASPKGADFALPTPDGRTIRLSDQKNKVVVLEFLQTGCPRCVEAGEMLQKIYQARTVQGVVMIGISHDQGGLPAIKKYVEEHKLTYPVVLGDLDVAVNYTGASPSRPSFEVPLFVFLDRDGNIAETRKLENLDDRDFYFQMPKSIEAIIDRLLSSEKKAEPRKKGHSRAGV